MTDTVVPCFYFPGNCEEAVGFYTSLLPDSRIAGTTHYGENGPLPAGSVMTMQFQLQGRPFMAVNGGPDFPSYSPALSLVAYAATQEELNRLWDALLAGGSAMACGWLTDRFGVSWQIVPTVLPELMNGPQVSCDRVMQALWGMVKLDIAELEAAAAAR